MQLKYKLSFLFIFLTVLPFAIAIESTGTFDVQIGTSNNGPSNGGTGGGGSGGGICLPSWNCTAWSDCTDSTQVRVCKDKWNCGDDSTKPIETQNCVMPQSEFIEQSSEMEYISPPTTNITESTKKPLENWQFPTFLIGTLLTIITYFYIEKRVNKNDNTKNNA